MQFFFSFPIFKKNNKNPFNMKRRKKIMRCNGTILKTAKAEDFTKENIKKALIELASCDSDFSGDNGAEYLTKEALEAGAKSNAEYFAEKVFDGVEPGKDGYETLNTVADEFLSMWTGCSNGYYYKADLDITRIGDSAVLSLMLVY